jgi:hypothetical protein
MSLSSIVLTFFAGAYYLGRVSLGSGLVKALSEHVFDKGVWRYVVTADVPMDIL